MAGGKNVYLSKKFLDLALGATAFSAPASTFIALFTTLPTDDSGASAVEVSTSGTSYARVTVTNNSTNWPASTGTGTNASPVTKQNGTTFTFATATGAWGTVTGFGIYDALTTGNLLYWGPLSVSKTINSGDTASFASNQITITEA